MVDQTVPRQVNVFVSSIRAVIFSLQPGAILNQVEESSDRQVKKSSRSTSGLSGLTS